jgi:uncharacterized repeat protein (TIGR01451 family)
MISFHNFGFVTAALAMLASPAAAETVVSMNVYRVTQEIQIIDSEAVSVEVLRPADSAIPGDKLTYQINVENRGEEPSEDISLNFPLSPHVTFIEGSVQGPIEITEAFSIDGGASYAPISDLFVVEDEVRRPASVADLTNLQISIPYLPVGDATQVAYSIFLN